MPLPVRHPIFFIPLVLGASSIATLLLYFNGRIEMGEGVRIILVPATVLLLTFLLWAKQSGRTELFDRIMAGLWAGALATLAYDLVRVPTAWSGVPVFKAISYFGTVILGQPTPTFTSEVAGWIYHLSNGIGFGLMYATFVNRPRWWTAVLWGVFLELLMLLTPYAEVFGYKVSSEFLAVTIGAHVVYGFALWAALRYWSSGRQFGTAREHSAVRLTLIAALVPIGIGIVAIDFHRRHGLTIPPSPPRYLGPHLYTTWNVLDPDRLAGMWLLHRFVDDRARFHFVAPFSQIVYGIPFDTPEAAIRRSGTRSVTEILLEQHHLGADSQFAPLARMAHLYEIIPWMLPADPKAQQFGQALLAAAGRCQPTHILPCVERAFQFLDAWYTQTDSSVEVSA